MIKSLSEVNSIIKGNRDCIVFYILYCYLLILYSFTMSLPTSQTQIYIYFKTQHI